MHFHAFKWACTEYVFKHGINNKTVDFNQDHLRNRSFDLNLASTGEITWFT